MFHSLFAGLLAATVASAAGENRQARLVSVPVSIDAKGNLGYTVMAGGQTLVAPSPLGITVDGKNLGEGVSLLSKSEPKSVIATFPLLGNHGRVRVRGSETVYELSSHGYAYGLAVRTYRDGMALRYLLPTNAATVEGEATAWRLPPSASNIVWAELSGCYEGLTRYTALTDLPTNSAFLGPLTVEVSPYYLSISEADNEWFPDMGYARDGTTGFKAASPWQKQWKAQPDWKAEPRVKLAGRYLGRPASPWRYTVVARTLDGLVNSDLAMALCPAAMEDFSWVKPGRSLWSWWCTGNVAYQGQNDWYDAAKRMGFEYYLVDEGWRAWKEEGKDQWALLKGLVDYGASNGVKTIAWVNSEEMRDAASRRAYLERVKALGISGIKIDFIPACTQAITQWYLGAIQDCVDLKLLVNFHGSVKPTGLRRTFPNDITREAVRGNEWHMTRYKRVMPPEQFTMMPFCRLLAGPADVTITMMDPAELKSARYTWANQLAQAIVFSAPLVHFCDKHEFYEKDSVKDLLQKLPTTWDETRVLPCTKIGGTVAIARRKGRTWWLGVMNGKDAVKLEIPLREFLHPRASVQATTLGDAPGEDAAVTRQSSEMKATDTLKLDLRPAGGFFARFEIGKKATK